MEVDIYQSFLYANRVLVIEHWDHPTTVGLTDKLKLEFVPEEAEGILHYLSTWTLDPDSDSPAIDIQKTIEEISNQNYSIVTIDSNMLLNN